MTIDFPTIRNQVTVVYHSVIQRVSLWKNYPIRLIDTASFYLNDKRLAIGTLVLANIIFFEVVIKICQLVNKILERKARYEQLSDGERNLRALGLGAISIGGIATGNWAYCRILRLPLPHWVIAVTSLSTCLVYLNLRLMFKKDK